MNFNTHSYLLPALSLGIAAFVSACGGGSNSSTSSTGINLMGTVTGLSGSVSFNWNSENHELNENGSFTISSAAELGEDINLSLSDDPSNQICAISSDTQFTDVSANIDDIVIECADSTVLNVTVGNYFTGDALADSLITVSWQEDAERVSRSTTTNVNGIASFEFISHGETVNISAGLDDFATHSIVANVPSGAAPINSQVLMLPIDAEVNFDAAVGGDLDVNGDIIVSLGAAALIDENGLSFSGEAVAEITLIDPSSDPSIMPGNYIAVDMDNDEQTSIESFGAITVEFRSTTGESLNLAEGQLATIRIPLAEDANAAPNTIPLYYFDEAEGFWVEEGSATLTTSDGASYYEGQVSHFTTWNADRPYDTVYISGCVQDAAGNPLANARVQTRGVDYLGSASDYSDVQGLFNVAARASSNILISALHGSQSRTLTQATTTSDADLAQCLVVEEAAATITLIWGDEPNDLDSHLYGPSSGLSDTFHIYFGNSTETVADTLIYLDVDDTSSFGPEIITIPRFPLAGTYHYGVHRYSGSGDIFTSPSRVELNIDGDVSIFTPPTGTPSDCWAVFDISVDDSLNVSITPKNIWESEAYCTDGEFDQTAPVSTKPNVIVQYGKSGIGKHYAK